jgi:cell division protein FtsL
MINFQQAAVTMILLTAQTGHKQVSYRLQEKANVLWRKLFNTDPATTNHSFINHRKARNSVALSNLYENIVFRRPNCQLQFRLIFWNNKFLGVCFHICVYISTVTTTRHLHRTTKLSRNKTNIIATRRVKFRDTEFPELQEQKCSGTSEKLKRFINTTRR